MADWALILGASSGFGEAVGLALAGRGFNIFGVQLDRKATVANAERIQKEMEAEGAKALFFNANAADPEKRAEIIARIRQSLSGGEQVRVLFHSIAFGTLKPLIADDPKDRVGRKQLEMTLDVMAHSLVYWAQDLVGGALMGEGGRIYAMTSAGGTRVWPQYGPVSAAKAALECHCRQLALELAPRGITANAIRAGVTDTPALRKIPGNDKMLETARNRNPTGRLTTPHDVAQAVSVLVDPATYWLTGNTLGVDGGEDIVG